MDDPNDVVAIGESNGEPELLEWLSVDCGKKEQTNVTINLIKNVQKSFFIFFEI